MSQDNYDAIWKIKKNHIPVKEVQKRPMKGKISKVQVSLLTQKITETKTDFF